MDGSVGKVGKLSGHKSGAPSSLVEHLVVGEACWLMAVEAVILIRGAAEGSSCKATTQQMGMVICKSYKRHTRWVCANKCTRQRKH